MIRGEIASTLINWMGGFRIRDVEVNGDVALADRMKVSVKVHICTGSTATNRYQTTWVMNKLWTFIGNAKFAKYLGNNYVMIYFKHAFVIL